MRTKSEKRWVWSLAVAAIVFTTFPYVLGFALQGSGWRFSGFIFGVEDGNSYIAKMLSGSVGEWLFRTPYTAYPQSGMIAFLPYILLGKLASQPGRHEQLVALFHIARWVAIVLYAHAAYDFISIFIKEVRHRRAALVLLFFGGGLGFLAMFGLKWSGWYGLPLEFYSPESFGFLAVFGLPHIVAGRAFLLWGLAQVFTHDLSQPLWRSAVRIGFFWTLLGLMQPLTVVVAWVILGAGLVAEKVVFAFRNRRQRLTRDSELAIKSKLGLLSVLFSAPIPIYTFLSFQLDPFLKSWNAQNLILSPPPLDYLLAYALVLPFVIAGSARALMSNLSGSAFLIGWLVIFPFLAYAPYPLQRRLPEGIWVCMVILAMVAIELDRKPYIWKRLQPVLYLGILSTLVLYTGGIQAVSTVGKPLYLPVAETRAYKAIELDTSELFPVVLANYSRSNHLPAWAPVRTLIGHGPESMDLKILQPLVESFLQGDLSETEVVDLLHSQKVSYILTGPDDPKAAVSDYPYLEWLYSDKDYTVYKVDMND